MLDYYNYENINMLIIYIQSIIVWITYCRYIIFNLFKGKCNYFNIEIYLYFAPIFNIIVAYLRFKVHEFTLAKKCLDRKFIVVVFGICCCLCKEIVIVFHIDNNLKYNINCYEAMTNIFYFQIVVFILHYIQLILVILYIESIYYYIFPDKHENTYYVVTKINTNSFYCAICCEEDVTTDLVIITTCNHMFHQNCIEKWFNSLKNNNKYYSCPTCRYVL